MLIEIIKLIFIASAILFSILIIMHKKITLKLKDNVKTSNFVAIIAFSLFAYIISALLIMFFISGLKYKILMLFFALCPFIIGKIATYQKIKLYSMFQLAIMIISAVIICIK